MPDVHARPPGIIVAAARSGAGKTTITAGLLRAFRQRGMVVGSAKCGPDYIDPGMHAVATGRPSVNLDSWAMRPIVLNRLLDIVETDADLVICEGVMGLFDGLRSEAPYGDGSTASIVARTGWPVLLILDVSGQAQTAAAVARGLADHRSDVEVAGVIVNRAGSERHAESCRAAIEASGLRVVGVIPRNEQIRLPERHLGLVQAQDLPDSERTLDEVARFVERHVDLNLVQTLARPSPNERSSIEPLERAMRPPGQRIALAWDAAFSFVYPHLLMAWRAAGAEIVRFSPLADEGPDPQADVCWLPGGYPELHAPALSAQRNFMSSITEFAQTRRVHGECGGYMVLGESLVDSAGRAHRMVGLLGHRTSFAQRRLHLGYRCARLTSEGMLGGAGTWCRGHEFHYATQVGESPDLRLFEASEPEGHNCLGTRRGHVSGSFFHLIDCMQ